MKLVIAEKPSVARSIAAVIGATDRQEGYLQGNGYLVSWCIGHLQRLYEDNAGGRLSDERFDMLSRSYEAEQKQLEPYWH